ncbi:peptide chain release factor N(5)-glutamine methyltransferase [Tropicibacter naphthalenivorans]|uniref:Release factor glutamine methyltransferase n=1 Tax=Tropicibacter naphthalenivorans TaxID=441103 RepID=A0A0P1H100_9RHOB|nr:peptide chain release factor N(5)-glutamine methyltransferase [Tropicibacter naphthalenivorans]CUH80133.1 Release factor glutamine methyltransferase [Tropicibacter naphthalenivorans]SMC84814.1 [protein release factor]-glutamine N5-methyltransferase [Tropicibacter naphthalenivorans]
MRASELLAKGTQTLAQAGVPDAGRDARRLMAHVLKVPPGRLTLFLPEPIDPDLSVIFNAMVERRAERVPVSHLTGRRQFYGREFLVTPEVLDPRPETETLIEAALAEPFASVLDLGTGSGCILLTLLAEREGAIGVGIDLSAGALNVAFWNRNALKLEQRAALEQGSWYAPLIGTDEQFDLIVSNPPYIAAEEMADLSPEVRDYEPRMALTDEGDGLSCYRLIVAGALAYLAPQGRLMVEIGPTQGAAVREMMSQAGLGDLRIIPDLDGRDRVVAGTRGAK